MNRTASGPLPNFRNNFKSKFSLSEMQIAIAGALGFDLSQLHLADILRPQLVDSNSTLSIVKRKKGFDFDDAELLEKIEALPPQELKALQKNIGLVTAMPPTDLFVGYLPSAHVVRRFDLAPPVATPAWGFLVVQLEGGAYFNEIVLHHGPGSVAASDAAIEGIAGGLVRRVRELRSNPAKGPDALLLALSYSLALSTGWRCVRVCEGEDGDIAVVQIPLASLQRDVMDGSLRGVVLPGVNAPPESGDI